MREGGKPRGRLFSHLSDKSLKKGDSNGEGELWMEDLKQKENWQDLVNDFLQGDKTPSASLHGEASF